MDEIRIDRLALRLSGLDESQGRHLAMLITQGLAAAKLSPGIATEHAAIRVNLTDSTTADLDLLSDHVVAELLRQIERSL